MAAMRYYKRYRESNISSIYSDKQRGWVVCCISTVAPLTHLRQLLFARILPVQQTLDGTCEKIGILAARKHIPTDGEQ